MGEKENASRLRAADFAHICGTNKRTLHHYDQIGLFAPALRGENGYRYYSQEQYDVFMVIAALKELGMPLLDIKAYLDRRDPAEPLCVVTDLVGGSVNLEAMRQLRTRDFYLISGANISLLLEMLFSEVSDGAQIEEIVNAAKDQMVYVNAMMGARSE